MNHSQQRAWAALGIGPVWRARTAPDPRVSTTAESCSEGADTQADRAAFGAGSLFGLADASGNWLFLGASLRAALPDDEMHLLGRMLAALGLDESAGSFVVGPEADERERATLDAHVERLAPRMIIALGERAGHRLLGGAAPMSAMRGRVHACFVGGRERLLVVTWHPAQLLRAPGEKAGAWADLCLARAALAAQSPVDGTP